MTQTPDSDSFEGLDGARLLDQAEEYFRTYTIQPSPHVYIALAVYVAYTHAAALFDFAPRLVLTSAEKRSGKTRTMEVVQAMSHRPLVAANATVAAIFRSLGGDDPTTLCLDEADTIFGTRIKAEQNEDLRGLLNAGFQKGTTVMRTVGPNHEVAHFQTFAPAVLAAIGHLPDTITDRAVNVRLRRRKQSETVAQYRLRRDQPQLLEHRARLNDWINAHHEDLLTAEPESPLEDRAADTWEPLLAVADLAGGRWPEDIRAAAVALTAEAAENDTEQSEGLELLADIRDVLGMVRSDFVPTGNLLILLKGKEESRWAEVDLTARRLSDRLKEYQIRPRQDSSGKVRGYSVRHFEDAFARYLPNYRQNPSEPSDTPLDQGERTDTSKPSDTSNRQTKTNRQDKTPGQNPYLTVQTGSDTGSTVDSATAATNATTPAPPTQEPNPDHEPTEPTDIFGKAADPYEAAQDTNGNVGCDNCGKSVRWRYAATHNGHCLDCAKTLKESA